MEIDRYLERVCYRGSRTPTLDTLNALHRAHVLNIPYENLDIHLGRTLLLEPHHIFDKLVRGRRGGWCYEMNGLFAWALRQLGFRVRLLAGTVRRPNAARLEGDHLVLVVELDLPYVADVGFGDGLIEPVPLAEGVYRQRFLEFRLEREGERWIFHNHEHGGAGAFDFTLRDRKLDSFAARCHELQTSPSSGFVQKTVCQRFTEHGIVTLRGALLRSITAAGVTDRVLGDASEFEQILRDVFDLHIPQAASLWQRVWERHVIWAAAQSRLPAPPA